MKFSIETHTTYCIQAHRCDGRIRGLLPHQMRALVTLCLEVEPEKLLPGDEVAQKVLGTRSPRWLPETRIFIRRCDEPDDGDALEVGVLRQGTSGVDHIFIDPSEWDEFVAALLMQAR